MSSVDLKSPKVQFTADAERKRASKPNPVLKWSLYVSDNIVQALRWARDNGWYEKKVQVRAETTSEDVTTYYVEPYEEGCGCRGLLRYLDYFGPPFDPQ